MTMPTKIEMLKSSLESGTPGDWSYDQDGYIYGGMTDSVATLSATQYLKVMNASRIRFLSLRLTRRCRHCSGF